MGKTWVYHHQRMPSGREASPPQGTDWMAGSSLRFLSRQGTTDMGKLSIQGGQLRDSTAQPCVWRRESHSQVTHADTVFDLKHPKLPEVIPLGFVHVWTPKPHFGDSPGKRERREAIAFSSSSMQQNKGGDFRLWGFGPRVSLRLREMCCCQTLG